MLRLRLLGPLELRGSGGEDLNAILAQPKRFALLAYLAVGSGAFHRRDSLLAVFWPDVDEFAARRSLRNSLYQLRRMLGDDVFVTRGDDEVMIDSSNLWCDVTALRAAVDARRYEEAIELYRGELLGGFHISNVGEGFEDWLTRARDQVSASTMRALRSAVDQSEATGNTGAAATWALRATQLAPFDEWWIRRAVSAVAANGDRASALRLFEAFARRLSAELETSPSEETLALVTRLRTAGGAATASSPARPSSSISSRSPPNGSKAATVDALRPDLPPVQPVAPDDIMETRARSNPPGDVPAVGAAVDPVQPAAGWTRRYPRRARLYALAAATVVVACVALAVWVRRGTPPTERQRVLVAVFDNRTGDPRLDPVSDMAIDWITRGILETGLADVVDPRVLFVRGRSPLGQPVDAVQLARRNGATTVITGSFYRSGDSLVFGAAVVDASTGRVLRSVGPVWATIARPVDGIEGIRSHLATALATVVDARFASRWTSDMKPPAFDSYSLFIEGWEAYSLNRRLRAESLFTLAARRDTAFDAAAIAAATAASNVMNCRGLVDSIGAAFEARHRRLGNMDRLNFGIATALCHGRNDEMFRLTLDRARLDPGSPLGVSSAAAALWANRPATAAQILERINPATDLDWMASPSHFDYWSDLTEAYHMSGRHDRELAAASRYGPAPTLARAWFRGRAFAALGRSDDALHELDSAFANMSDPEVSLGLGPNTNGRNEYVGTPGAVAVWIARELTVHGDSAAGRVAATRAMGWFQHRSTEERQASEVRLLEAWALEQMGRLDEAQALVRGLLAEDSLNVDYRGTMAGLCAVSGDLPQAQRLDAWLAAFSPQGAPWGGPFYRARVAVLLGHPDQAVALVRESFDRGAWPMWVHMDAALLRLRGRADFVAAIRPVGG